MSAAPPPPPSAPLACQARAGALVRPTAAAVTHWRSAWCARRGDGVPERRWPAMRPGGCGPACGSTEGTTPRVPYLNAIANDVASLARSAPARGAQHHQPHPPLPAPLRRPPAVRRRARCRPRCSPAAAGTARCSRTSCRYTFDRVVNRCPTRPPGENASPAKLFAACRTCAEIVARLHPQLATRAGLPRGGRARSRVGAVSLARISLGPARPRRMAHRDPRRRPKRLSDLTAVNCARPPAPRDQRLIDEVGGEILCGEQARRRVWPPATPGEAAALSTGRSRNVRGASGGSRGEGKCGSGQRGHRGRGVFRHSDGSARAGAASARSVSSGVRRVWAPAVDNMPITAAAVSFLGMVLSSIPSALIDEGHDLNSEIGVRLRQILIGFQVAQHHLVADHALGGGALRE